MPLSVPTAGSADGAASSHRFKAPLSSASQCPQLIQRKRSRGITDWAASATSGNIWRGPVWKSSASSPATRNWLKVKPPGTASVNVESR
jgi:sugar lactone lactonase YvrE